MTLSTVRVVRRCAVALLALACLSPAELRLPNLSTVPAILGLVPEPAQAPPSRAPVFHAIDAGPGQHAGAATVTRRPGPTTLPGDVAGAPPRPERGTSGGDAAGAALPVLPPDETPRGRYHRVEPGETAAAIAAAYGLRSKWDVYDANPVLVHPDRLPSGVWLYIPHPSTDPARRPRPGERGYTGAPSNTVMVDAIWLQLAQCESSGNWSINSGNSYYGGLQFTLQSWRLVGGAGYPHEAHPMEQIARADYLQRIQGWKAWPLCAEKLGLLPPGEGQRIVDAARARQRAEATAPAPTERSS